MWEFHWHEGKIVRVVGDFVCEKFVKTKHGDLMKFGTFLDAEGHLLDTIHFPQSLDNYPLRGAGIYLVEAKVAVEHDCPSIEVISCAKMPLKPHPRSE